MLVARFSHRIALLAILGLWPLSGSAANAQTCHMNAPRYSLSEDIVSWSMTIENGRRCIRGVRFANVQFDGLKLVSPPQFGEVALQGSGFIYSPKANFHGQDAFSLVVIGAINRKPGSSTIQVTVSDNSSRSTSADTTPPPVAFTAPSEGATISSPDTTPPSVAFTAPSEGATISGPDVVLTATASDDVAVANVQFFLAGKKIGSAVASPPYATVWDSMTVADGSYTLYVVAQDTSGNSENSWVHVTVKNK